jgi:hypothetical protein
MSRVLIALALLISAAPAARAQTSATIRTGMTEAEVRAAWGAPVATRQRATFTYLFYATDCMARCGSHDLAILENGRLVDAVARAGGHCFEGRARPAPTPTLHGEPR